MIESNIVYCPGWERVAARAFSLGYSSVVVGVTCKGSETNFKKLLPPREALLESLRAYLEKNAIVPVRVPALLRDSYCGLALDILYTRITVELDDVAQTTTLLKRLEANAQGYFDVVAVAPSDERTLQAACALPFADTVLLDTKWFLLVKRKYFQAVAARNAKFEIPYADKRPDALLSMGLMLAAAGSHGRRAFLLSSGADAPHKVRAPNDVVAVAVAMGFTHEAAAAALGREAADVLLNGRVRSRLDAGLFVYDDDGRDTDTEHDEAQPPKKAQRG